MTSSPSQNDIHNIFNQVAHRYDYANDLMSLGTHRIWKKLFVKSLPKVQHGVWLDIGAGSGDIAYLLSHIHKHLQPTIHACEPNKNMLQEGKKKCINKGALSITWHQTCALHLPFSDNFAHGTLFSFSLRNIKAWKRALDEAYRCTKPKGYISILEFNPLGSRSFPQLYRYYQNVLIPKLGHIASGYAHPYTYLAESIQSFATPADLCDAMKQSGWSLKHMLPISDGIAMVYLGEK